MKKNTILSGMILGICFSMAVLGASPEGPSRANSARRLAPVVIHPVKADLSPPLRLMEPGPSARKPSLFRQRERDMEVLPKAKAAAGESLSHDFDPMVQAWPGSGAMPTPATNWDGIANVDNVIPVLPPDTEGDVGPDHYVQWVNLSLAIWDKSGTLLYGPVPGNTIWNGFGGPADSSNDGDPIIVYDGMADRWLISQFALPHYPNPPFYQYIAVSQTPDPTGPWYRYAYEWPPGKMNDYPKFGVWPDGYYMSVNQFTSGEPEGIGGESAESTPESWGGAGVAVFDRTAMLSGDPGAELQYVDLGTINLTYGGMLPSQFEGSKVPPAGAPNVFMEVDDDAWGFDFDRLSIWFFHVDWDTPANTTFGLDGEPNAILRTGAFDSDLCGYGDCIPQPDTAATLDSLSDRLMYRLQYRNFGDHESLVVNHSVDVDGLDHAGVRWYELRDDGTGWAIYQQGTYAPDSDNRWMASAAMDHAGDLAVGYSVSGPATYPSVRYSGRLAGDPLGELTQGEAELVAGSGSQTNANGRWGDYSALNVDPADDCTFWYTQEYYSETSTSGWKTRIGSFKFSACDGVAPIALSLESDVTSGPIPLTVSFSASASGGTGPYSYSWVFGDGTLGSGASPSHTYSKTGQYKVWVTASDGVAPTHSESITVEATVEPPVITSVKKRGQPFRLKVFGSNFHPGCTVAVNGVPAPYTTFKNSGKVVGKKGRTLKDMVPKGVPVEVTVTNNDDGGVSQPFSFTR